MQQEAFLLFIQKRMMTFEHQPYILNAAPDDSPLDIEKVIRFYQSLKTTPLQIRMSIEQSLSWKAQMQIVINETFE